MAKDVLKTFLLPVARPPLLGHSWDCVTVRVEGSTPLVRLLPPCVGISTLSKTSCTPITCGATSPKQLIYGPTKDDRQAWEALGGIAVEVSGNGSVFHRVHMVHHTLVATMDAQRWVAERLGVGPGSVGGQWLRRSSAVKCSMGATCCGPPNGSNDSSVA